MVWVSLCLSYLVFVKLVFLYPCLSSDLWNVWSLFLSVTSLPFSLFPPAPPIMSTLVSSIVSHHKYLRLCSLFFLLFSFCSSVSIVSNDLSSSLLILSFCLCLLLNSSSYFFQFNFIFLSSRVSIWLFLIIPIFL